MSSQPDLDQLQRRIGYQFKSPERLLLALTHRSYGNQNNERLEFLGDSIVNMVIAHVWLRKNRLLHAFLYSITLFTQFILFISLIFVVMFLNSYYG